MNLNFYNLIIIINLQAKVSPLIISYSYKKNLVLKTCLYPYDPQIVKISMSEKKLSKISVSRVCVNIIFEFELCLQ